MINRILSVLLLVAVAVVAPAQQDPFHRPGFLAGRTMLTLCLFDEVKTELKTSADFNAKADDMLDKLQGEMRDAFQNANGDFASVRPEIEKIDAKYDDEVLQLLSPDQVARLKQLFIQYNGPNAIPNAAISKDLAITDDQKAKIKQAQDDSSKKMMGIFTNGGSPEDNRAAILKLQDELGTAIENLLTDAQKAKFKEMQGAKFEFKKVT